MSLVVSESRDLGGNSIKVSIVDTGLFPNPFMQFDIEDELLVKSNDELNIKLLMISKASKMFFGKKVIIGIKDGKFTADYE